MVKKPDIRFVSWDWKEHPDEQELRSVLGRMGVHVRYVDEGNDSYILAFSKKPFTQKEGNKALKAVFE